MALLEPALVRYLGRDIEILVVFPMPDGLFAFVDGNYYQHIGQVEKRTVVRHGMDVEVWEARDATGEWTARGRSRASTVRALLKELGYYPIRVLDTIPALF